MGASSNGVRAPLSRSSESTSIVQAARLVAATDDLLLAADVHAVPQIDVVDSPDVQAPAGADLHRLRARDAVRHRGGRPAGVQVHSADRHAGRVDVLVRDRPLLRWRQARADDAGSYRGHGHRLIECCGVAPGAKALTGESGDGRNRRNPSIGHRAVAHPRQARSERGDGRAAPEQPGEAIQAEANARRPCDSCCDS